MKRTKEKLCNYLKHKGFNLVRRLNDFKTDVSLSFQLIHKHNVQSHSICQVQSSGLVFYTAPKDSRLPQGDSDMYITFVAKIPKHNSEAPGGIRSLSSSEAFRCSIKVLWFLFFIFAPNQTHFKHS